MQASSMPAATAAAATTAAAQPIRRFLSVSRAIGAPVWGRANEYIGRLADAVARVEHPGDERFPPLTGIVVRVGGTRWGAGGHNVFVRWDAVKELTPDAVRLSSSRLDLRPFERRDGELLVAGDVLDKQVVDVGGRRVVRVNDVELAPDPRRAGGWRVAAADVDTGSFIARVVPKTFAEPVRRRFPNRPAIPWDQVEFFASDVPGVKLRVDHSNLARMHPADIAELIADLGYRQGEEVLAALDEPTAADVMENLPSELQGAVLTAMDEEKAADILDEMEPDVAADILAELPEEEAQDLLEAMEPEEAADVSELMKHAPDTAGGLMTTDFLAVPATLTVAEAIERLRGEEALPSIIPYLYAVESDDAPTLLGMVRLRDLLLARPEQRIGEVMNAEVLSVPVDEEAEEAAEQLAHYDLVELPVVDAEGRLVGVITVDDALDVLLPDEWKPRLPRMFR